MKTPKLDGWYAKKSFPHFDLPMDFSSAHKIVRDQNLVSQHSYRPFLGFTERKRRFKPRTTKKYDVKTRALKYCSHVDGYIHSYYAKALSEAYESYIKPLSISDCVVGYRSGLGTNIHFSNEVFDHIRARKSCVAIAFDISSFFDSIDHARLKQEIQRVLGCGRLTEDWFSVYKSMTKFSWIEIDELEVALRLKAKSFGRPICSAKDFRDLRSDNPDLVKTNRQLFGIPQGSPISAVMSNVFMLGFDVKCEAFLSSIGGFYRRYSDDVIVVCDVKDRATVERFIEDEITSLGSAMRISTEKTEVSVFSVSLSGSLICDRPLTYLGFTFDGSRVLLRDRTVSRYYRRMTYGGRGASMAAKKSGTTKVFRRKLITQFSHLGSSNFYTYAKRAAAILGDSTPKRQLRRHFRNLYKKSKA